MFALSFSTRRLACVSWEANASDAARTWAASASSASTLAAAASASSWTSSVALLPASTISWASLARRHLSCSSAAAPASDIAPDCPNELGWCSGSELGSGSGSSSIAAHSRRSSSAASSWRRAALASRSIRAASIRCPRAFFRARRCFSAAARASCAWRADSSRHLSLSAAKASHRLTSASAARAAASARSSSVTSSQGPVSDRFHRGSSGVPGGPSAKCSLYSCALPCPPRVNPPSKCAERKSPNSTGAEQSGGPLPRPAVGPEPCSFVFPDTVAGVGAGSISELAWPHDTDGSSTSPTWGPDTPTCPNIAAGAGAGSTSGIVWPPGTDRSSTSPTWGPDTPTCPNIAAGAGVGSTSGIVWPPGTDRSGTSQTWGPSTPTWTSRIFEKGRPSARADGRRSADTSGTAPPSSLSATTALVGSFSSAGGVCERTSRIRPRGLAAASGEYAAPAWMPSKFSGVAAARATSS